MSTNINIENTYFIKNSTLRCPVKYLEAYLQKAKLNVSNDKESQSIYRIFKTKSGHRISKTKGISYSRIREIFKDYISKIATTPQNFGFQSFRSGDVSAVTDRLISKQVCWSSEKARNFYIRDSVVKRLTD